MSNVVEMRAPEADRAYRTLPANVEAEQALLGAILVNNAAFYRVSDFLRPEHFAEGVHGRIFEAIAKRIDAGQIANPVTLKNLFDQDAALAEIGGAQYLARLAGSVVTIINAEDYGRTILDLFLRRQLITIGEDVVNGAYEHDLERDAPTIMRNAEEAFDALRDGRAPNDRGLVDSAATIDAALALADEAHKHKGRLLGVPTGLVDLDKLLGGLRRGHLVVLGGRPSMGKTALADGIACAAARHFAEIAAAAGGKPTSVIEFQLEMSHEELGQRRLAAETRMAVERIANGRLDQHEFEALAAARASLAKLPLFVDDTPRLSVSDIRSRARRLARRRGIGLIVIDHLGLVRASREAQRNGETAAVTEITAALKALAKDLDAPVLALSQLNRDVERREDKRPLLADLRQSGSIEQDADVVMFVFREEYYLSRAEPTRQTGESVERFTANLADWSARSDASRNLAEISVAKHRNGRTGIVRCHFDGELAAFSNLYDQRGMP